MTVEGLGSKQPL